MQAELFKAIAVKLRSDTGAGSLVALTKHSSTDIRISRDKSPAASDLPYLGIAVLETVPQMSDVSHISSSVVSFIARSSEELTAIQIADRMHSLLVPDDNDPLKDSVRYKYDFSNTDIRNLQTTFLKRINVTLDEEVEHYVDVVQATIKWSLMVCV